MISSERPNREVHQFLDPIVEQLTIVHGKRVELKLEIVPKSPLAWPRQKVEAMIENANTLVFLEKDR